MAFVVHDYHRRGGHSGYVVEQATRFQEQHEVHVFANTWDATGSEKIQFHKVSALTNREILKVRNPSADGRDFCWQRWQLP